MATIIRLADPPHGLQAVALNFDDLAVEAGQYVAEVKAEAAEIVAEARQQADSIRQQAAKEGAEAAVRAVDQMVAEQLAPALAALQQAAADLQHAKQAWLSHWESSAVHLAAAIAARIVRGELRRQPEITLDAGARGVGVGRRQPQRAIAPQSGRPQVARSRRCER